MLLITITALIAAIIGSTDIATPEDGLLSEGAVLFVSADSLDVSELVGSLVFSTETAAVSFEYVTSMTLSPALKPYKPSSNVEVPVAAISSRSEERRGRERVCQYV